MSALFCLFLYFRSYSKKLEVYNPIFFKIRYILEELYVAVILIISRLIIYIDQLNKGLRTSLEIDRTLHLKIKIVKNMKANQQREKKMSSLVCRTLVQVFVLGFFLEKKQKSSQQTFRADLFCSITDYGHPMKA